MTYHNRPRGSRREPAMIHGLSVEKWPGKTACYQDLARREYTSLPEDVTCAGCRTAMGLPPRVIATTVIAEPDWEWVRERIREDQRAKHRAGKTGAPEMIPLEEVEWTALWPDGEVTRHSSARNLLLAVKQKQARDARYLERVGRDAIVVTTVDWRDVPKGFVAPKEEDL